MSTIAEVMKLISHDIQKTSEELIKQFLRKSLRPTLNPVSNGAPRSYPKTKSIHAVRLSRFAPQDVINNNHYLLTQSCLGWNDDILTTFKAVPKVAKNKAVSGIACACNGAPKSTIRASVERPNERQVVSCFKTFLSMLGGKSLQRSPNIASFVEVSYTYAYRPLESIGQDIIDHTDPCISAGEASRMSTASLRIKIYNLERDLAELSVKHPSIFEAYVEMIKLINSQTKTKINWIINLIALLSYQSWDELTEDQRSCHIETMGPEFMTRFNSNELITVLLQSGNGELILTSAYLYALMKMLFIVFGYSRLVPIINDDNLVSCARQKFHENLERYFDKNRGASIRRSCANPAVLHSTLHPTVRDALTTARQAARNPIHHEEYVDDAVIGHSDLDLEPGYTSSHPSIHPSDHSDIDAYESEDYGGYESDASTASIRSNISTASERASDPMAHVAASLLATGAILPQHMRNTGTRINRQPIPSPMPQHLYPEGEYVAPTRIPDRERGTVSANYPRYAPHDAKPTRHEVEPEPIDPRIYDFIKSFGELYPTLIGLMGGTEHFPDENIEVGCRDIPASYDDLYTIPEFLWRFNDYAYCVYVENTFLRRDPTTLKSKVKDKIKYLATI